MAVKAHWFTQGAPYGTQHLQSRVYHPASGRCGASGARIALSTVALEGLEDGLVIPSRICWRGRVGQGSASAISVYLGLLGFVASGCGQTHRVNQLIGELKDRDANRKVRDDAAEALVRIGPPAVKPLIAVLKDQRGDVRSTASQARSKAAQALGEINDRRAVEPLTAALNDPDLDVQRNVAAALFVLGAAR